MLPPATSVLEQFGSRYNIGEQSLDDLDSLQEDQADMEKSQRLVVAVAEKCKSVIQNSENTTHGVPESLRPKHLLWMCDKIQRHAEDWPATKLHRWIGFVQCGMMANRIVGFDGIKEIVEDVKKSHGEGGEDQDLIDHLDPDSSFRLDIGGEA